jgi:hypothetical protein
VGGRYRPGLAALGISTLDVPRSADRPGVAQLPPNQPNPFHGRTWITFSLPAPAPVTLRVFDLGGRVLASPAVRESRAAGPQRLEFDGRGLPSGIYLVRLETDREVASRRIVLLRRPGTTRVETRLRLAPPLRGGRGHDPRPVDEVTESARVDPRKMIAARPVGLGSRSRHGNTPPKPTRRRVAPSSRLR